MTKELLSGFWLLGAVIKETPEVIE